MPCCSLAAGVAGDMAAPTELADVRLHADTYMACVTHALSTEREEVMGLLLGSIEQIGVRFPLGYALLRG